mmetsp:Transcript_12558/g.56587  ORF Transcript_12558/g.56587 Transcript_12558/m.56587 type:complete len:200 (-) Transcript_12558:149-748(-)
MPADTRLGECGALGADGISAEIRLPVAFGNGKAPSTPARRMVSRDYDPPHDGIVREAHAAMPDSGRNEGGARHEGLRGHRDVRVVAPERAVDGGQPLLVLGRVRASRQGAQTRGVGVVAAGDRGLLRHRRATGVHRGEVGAEGAADVLRRVRDDERVEQRRRVSGPARRAAEQSVEEQELVARSRHAETDAVAAAAAGA